MKAKVKANCELPQREVGCDLHEPSRDSFCGYVPAAEASTAPEEWNDDNGEEQGWNDENWIDENWEGDVSQTV